MKVSIITAVKNNSATIGDCIKSVLSQTYANIEHIIIDGSSTDGTLGIVNKFRDKITKVVSEPDNGIYDALNKGIKLATGEIIGFLHADDIYADEKVIEKAMDVFLKHNVDSCYGDLLYVDRNNTDRIIRYWKSSPYRNGSFRYGWHPPHPTFFAKKRVYEQYGLFRTDLSIAADYEVMLRFMEKYRIKTHYIPEVLVKMRMGGKSNRSLRNILLQTHEDYKAWRINGLEGGMLAVFLKKLKKAPQFVKKMKG